MTPAFSWRNTVETAMRKRVLSKAQTALLKRFDEIGGCVEYVVFDCDSSVDDIESADSHRDAAIAALQKIGKDWAEHAVKASKEHKMPIAKFFVLKIDLGKAMSSQSKRITPQEFLGPHYDFQTCRLFDKQSYSDFAGYAYAFWQPPYGLCDFRPPAKRVSVQEATELFHEINQEVLGGVTPQSIIYQWPVDWSNFFDAGQEWWGSFLWTFANPGTQRIVVLAASTTD
jgi:hypothetical protein